MFAHHEFEFFPNATFVARAHFGDSAHLFYFQSIPHCSCTLFPQLLCSHHFKNWVPGGGVSPIALSLELIMPKKNANPRQKVVSLRAPRPNFAGRHRRR
jgi:hypothetical protein